MLLKLSIMLFSVTLKNELLPSKLCATVAIMIVIMPQKKKFPILTREINAIYFFFVVAKKLDFLKVLRVSHLCSVSRTYFSLSARLVGKSTQKCIVSI